MALYFVTLQLLGKKYLSSVTNYFYFVTCHYWIYTVYDNAYTDHGHRDKVLTLRNYKKFSTEFFINDLLALDCLHDTNWSSNLLMQKWDEFKNVFINISNIHTPFHCRRLKRLSRTGTKRKRREAETDGCCATALTLYCVFTDGQDNPVNTGKIIISHNIQCKLHTPRSNTVHIIITIHYTTIVNNYILIT